VLVFYEQVTEVASRGQDFDGALCALEKAIEGEREDVSATKALCHALQAHIYLR
jgi:hypothetical protein